MSTPGETAREASLRARVIWSFWLVIVLLALPSWWATTSIYRASLPTELMLGSHDDLWYSIPVCLHSSSISLDELSKLAWDTQKLAKGPQYLFKFNVESKQQCQPDGISTIIFIQQGNDYKIEYSPDSSSFQATYPESGLGSLSFDLSTFLQSSFLEELASIAYQLHMDGKSDYNIKAFVQTLPEDVVGEVQKSTNRAFKPGSDYHLTFSLFTAGPAPSSWDIRQSLENSVQPILHALSATKNISVASQIQLYSSFSPAVQPHQGEHGWHLKKDDLTSFVNTAEWPLAPSIGTGSTINFITYVPGKKYIPLRLENSPSNSWLVPQWGGITILNPPLIDVDESELGLKALQAHLDQESLIPAFEIFQTQLLQLLGVPQLSKLPLTERLKAFQRLSALSLYLRTSSNLGALARLAQRLNKISIPKHVLHSVENSLYKLSVFRQCFNFKDTTSRTWSTCLSSVREAFSDSEKAFFDKSMVGQVYFPDEHKVAVYLPLLGPVGVPLVVGLISELKTLAARRQG